MKGSFKTALIAAVVSAVVSASAAVATTSNFILGSTTANVPDAPTAVTAKNVSLGGLNAKMLQLTNNSTGSSATALGLTTPSSRPPLIVNSQAKVANLNADKLDGIDSTAFLARGVSLVGSISLGSVAAHHCLDVSLGVTGAQVGHVPLIGFQGTVPLPSGLILMAMTVPSPNQVRARICNPTDTASVATSDIGVRIITLK
jgi:hypothetical protein